MYATIKNYFRLRRSNILRNCEASGALKSQTLAGTLPTLKVFASVSLPLVVFLLAALSVPAALAATTPTPTASPTYSGLLLYNTVSSPIKVAAGATAHGVAPVRGKAPLAAAYGVIARAIVFVQGGPTDTTCLVKLAGGAVSATPITLPANTTISIPFCDTSPGFPGESYNLAMAIQAGTGGSLTILPPTSLTIEAIASKPNNNAY